MAGKLLRYLAPVLWRDTMKPIQKKVLFLFLNAAWIGEILEMALREYEELCLTAFLFGILLFALSLVYYLRNSLLFALSATLLGATGVVLLILFPDYICYVAILFLLLSLLWEILLLVNKFKEKRKEKEKEFPRKKS